MNSSLVLPLLAAALVSALLDFYLCLLVHWRYSGQFGLWFFVPCAIVFSLPSLFLSGLPLWLILIAPASLPLRLILFCLWLILTLRLLIRLTRLFLSKRFAVPAQRSMRI